MRSPVFGAALLMLAALPAHAAEHVIKMTSDPVTSLGVFEPKHLAIQPGDKVTWVQKDGSSRHNVAAYPDRIPEGTIPFESPMMSKVGQQWSMTFRKEGTYEFHCHPHEKDQMRGVVIVGRPSRPEEMRKQRPGDMHHDHGDGAKPHRR